MLRTAYRFIHDLVYAALLGAVYAYGALMLASWPFLLMFVLDFGEPPEGLVSSLVLGAILLCFLLGLCLAALFGIMVGYHAAQRIGGGGLMGLAVGLTALVLAAGSKGSQKYGAIGLAHWWYWLALMITVLVLPVLGGSIYSHNWGRSSRFRRWMERQTGQLGALVGVALVFAILGGLFRWLSATQQLPH